MVETLRVERCYRPDRKREIRALLVLLGHTSISVTTPRRSRHASAGAEFDADPGHGRDAG
jgi:hypothetical protein